MSVLAYAPRTRAVLRCTTLVLVAFVFGLPLLILALASLAGRWNGILPSAFTIDHLAHGLAGGNGRALWHSIATGLLATGLATALGGWGALAGRGLSGPARRALDALFLLPIAIPSVSIGLALLVAFSRKPFLLNGTIALVVIGHVVLITAYAYAGACAGLEGLPVELESMASSLGAAPARVLLSITLPLLRPHLLAAAALGFALSMGELGATIMLYPPFWVTAPVRVFALTDRGAMFAGAALGTILLAVTFATLRLLDRSWGAAR